MSTVGNRSTEPAEAGNASSPASIAQLIRAVGLATVLPVALGVVGSPLLARAMDPADRGRVAGILAAATVANVIALGGSPQGLPQRLAVLDPARAWPVVVATARQLRLGVLLCSLGLAAVSAFVWPGSVSQVLITAAIVLLWWVAGILRSVLVGIGDHRRATGMLLIEAASRFGAIVVLSVGWSVVDAPLALFMVGLVPILFALGFGGPRLVKLRSDAHRSTDQTETSVAPVGWSGMSLSLGQQFMGRSMLSVWALALPEESVGYFAVAFALTEMTVNFARIAQPFIIQRAETGHVNVLPWIAVTSLAACLSAVGGVFLVEPMFGVEYVEAVQLVVPLALAQGFFAIVVIFDGVRFISDPRDVTRSIVCWQTLSVVVTLAVAAATSAVVVAITFAVLAGAQAIASWSASHGLAITRTKSVLRGMP